ncbi:MAG: tail fiber domain-containing protein [Candidatus Sumerlaeaceae bacterium]
MRNLSNLWAAAILLFASGALAAQPLRFNYQAKLDSSGLPLTGTHTLYFKVYRGGTANGANTGELLYSESAQVTADAGVVNHTVATGTVIFGSITNATFSSALDYYLQVSIDTDDNVVLPRTRLNTVPFAAYANLAETATSASAVLWANVSGKPAGFADNIDNDSGGDITGITAGDGLSGGGSTGEPTLNAVFPSPGGLNGSQSAIARYDHAHSSLSPASNGTSQSVTVDASGRVAIGTTSPQALLHVNGDVAASALLLPNAQTSKIAYSAANDALLLSTRGPGLDQKQELDNTSAWGNFDVSQTFTAGITGDLVAVEILRGNSPYFNATVELRQGALLASATVPGGSSLQWQRATFAAPVPVIAGQVYTIRCTSGGALSWLVSFDNPYPGGQSPSSPLLDCAFRTYVKSMRPGLSLIAATNTVSIPANLTVGGTVGELLKLTAPTDDPSPMIASRTVPAGQGASIERSELILFHGNDNSTDWGPDLITLRAPNIRLQTFNDGTVDDIDNNAGSNDRLTIDTTGTVTVQQNLVVAGQAYKPGGGNWATVSDASVKKNVHTISGALEKLLKLRGVTYQWKNPVEFTARDEALMGMIADEVEQVFPEWVKRDAQGRRTLEIVGFEGLAVEAVKDLESKVESQQHQLNELKRIVDELRHEAVKLKAPSGTQR